MLYPIGYGSLFDPANPSSSQTKRPQLHADRGLQGQHRQEHERRLVPDSQRIYGTPQQRIDRIQKVFTDIMQSGVQISLIQ